MKNNSNSERVIKFEIPIDAFQKVNIELILTSKHRQAENIKEILTGWQAQLKNGAEGIEASEVNIFSLKLILYYY